MFILKIISFTAFVVVVSAQLKDKADMDYYDTFTGNKISEEQRQSLVERNLTRFCMLTVKRCDPYEGRRLDGTCNNLKHPTRGGTLTPYIRLLPGEFGINYGIRPAKSGRPLPPTRIVRTALISDGKVSGKIFTQLTTYFLAALVGEVTSLHDTVNYVLLTVHCCRPSGSIDPLCNPIEVPDDDPYLRLTDVRCLNQTRSITYQFVGCLSNNVPPERINTATPVLDQSLIYGNTAEAANKARLFKDGLLKFELDEKNREFPPSGGVLCRNNEPPNERRCHDTPNIATNSLVGPNMYAIWFWREHNRLARQLTKINPCWDDEKVFAVARQINIATQQYIYIYELLPEILGYENSINSELIFPTPGYVNDYDKYLEPGVSLEFVFGTRWFHIMQDGDARMYNKEGKYLGRRTVVDDTVRTGIFDVNDTIGDYTRGSFRQPSGKIDYIVDPDIGERVLGRQQRASDVISSDINKGRDFGFPPYNTFRRLCGLPVAKKFHDFLDTIDKERVEILSDLYENPDDVELYAGILAERQMKGAKVGPTLFCLMTDQVRRWRRADRFWFEHSGHPTSFNEAQLLEIRRTSMSRVLCDSGDGVEWIQPRSFLVPRPGNEMVSCRQIDRMDLEQWRDHICPNKHKQYYHQPYYRANVYNKPFY